MKTSTEIGSFAQFVGEEKAVELGKNVTDTVLLRISEMLAVVMLTVDLLEEFENLKFSKEEMYTKMMDIARENLQYAQSNQINSVVKNEIYPLLLDKAEKCVKEGKLLAKEKECAKEGKELGVMEKEVTAVECEQFIFVTTAKWKQMLAQISKMMDISKKEIEKALKKCELLIPKDGTKDYCVKKTMDGKSKRPRRPTKTA